MSGAHGGGFSPYRSPADMSGRRTEKKGRGPEESPAPPFILQEFRTGRGAGIRLGYFFFPGDDGVTEIAIASV